jgi:Domain of unknown function (DUF4198)
MSTSPARRSRPRGVVVLAFILPALLTSSSPPALAHDLWILPGKYRIAPGETTRVFINNGDVFPESLTLLGRQRLSGVEIRGPDGDRTITELRVDGKSLTFEIEAKAPGTYVVAIGTHTRRVRMNAEDFRDYLTEEKLDEISKLREEKNESDAAAVERYAKWAKTVVDVGESAEKGEGESDTVGAWAEPVGQPLEIVPLVHPNRVEPGGELPIRVLFRGEPLPGVNVIGARASGRDREITTRTNDQGEAMVTVSAPGRWYLRALHMIRLEDDPEMRWESFWCTLSFEIPLPKTEGQGALDGKRVGEREKRGFAR